MTPFDWAVLAMTLSAIVGYGLYRSQRDRSMQSYLLADKSMPWYHVTFSIMATQASAVTFLSTPGQAYTDGMRFVQFYFGLPLAMVVLCITFVPRFHKLNVFTAYEYLESRFDVRVRGFTSFLFLVQRGLSTGLSIYAPAIILSSLLGIDIVWTNIITGGLVLLYTVIGGARAVSHTHLLQMAIVTAGMIVAGIVVLRLLPKDLSLWEAMGIAGKMGKVNLLDFKFDLDNRYNVWSGIIGGFFLQLSYFGTDQSQVSRYLTGRSVGQSRLGLVMNGLLKIPMQFGILLLGVLVFVFYQFVQPPLFFDRLPEESIKAGQYAGQYEALEKDHHAIFERKSAEVKTLKNSLKTGDEAAIATSKGKLNGLETEMQKVRTNASELLSKATGSEVNDVNYIFLRFVTDYLPVGLVGLLMGVILLASMGSVSAAYNSLASTTVVDFYKRFWKKGADDRSYVKASKWSTVFWGLFSMLVAQYAGRLGSMIEAVNVLGSLFYGVILGIFLVAFYFKSINSRAVFYGAILSEILVVISFWLELTAFLWLNVIGCLLVIIFAGLIEKAWPNYHRARP